MVNSTLLEVLVVTLKESERKVNTATRSTHPLAVAPLLLLAANTSNVPIDYTYPAVRGTYHFPYLCPCLLSRSLVRLAAAG